MYKFCFKDVDSYDNFVRSVRKCTNAVIKNHHYNSMLELFEVEVEFTCEFCFKEASDV